MARSMARLLAKDRRAGRRAVCVNEPLPAVVAYAFRTFVAERGLRPATVGVRVFELS